MHAQRRFKKVLGLAVFAALLSTQLTLATIGAGEDWTRGHNGWNSSAYYNSARNALRWKVLFPLQYSTQNTPPKAKQLYTHHPLGLHVHNTLAYWFSNGHRASVRLVAGWHGVLALLALLFVVCRLWDSPTALLAGAVYVALPINAIYINMANHSSGFIAWSLLALLLYVRSRQRLRAGEGWRWLSFAGFFVVFALSAQWDWPAYYLAFVIAVDWALRIVCKKRVGSRDTLQLAIFCSGVLLLFLSHFALVYLVGGSLDELIKTFSVRQGTHGFAFLRHLRIVPALMFTWTVLIVAAGWLIAFFVRVSHQRTQVRDLIPFAYAFAGITHYLLFKSSAVVHSFWAWTALPFVAIAVSVSIMGAGDWLAARFSNRTATRDVVRVVCGALLLIPLLARSVSIVPEARVYGGSMWFFKPVRPYMDRYDSGRPELRFARFVRNATDRDTGVLVHPDFERYRLEPRFDIALDRPLRKRHSLPTHPPNALPDGVRHWVFIAPVASFSEEDRVKLAKIHPYLEVDDHFMLDLGSQTADVRVWRSRPQDPSLTWTLFHSYAEPPVSWERDLQREHQLAAR